MTYASNFTWVEMAEVVGEAKRLAVVTHRKPDGDAIGSALALRRGLAAKGKSVDIYLMGPIEPVLAGLLDGTPIHDPDTTPPRDDYDAILVVDTGAWSQVEPLEPWLRRHHEHVLGIDHHSHGDTVAARRIVEPGAASTASLVAELLDALGVKLTPGRDGIAEPLFVGLATDTGWFRYQNADPAAFTLAARLLAIGVDKSSLFQAIEASHRPERLALAARALASLEYASGGAVAIQSLRPDDFTETGGGPEDLTGVVNAPMVVGTVRVSVLLTQAEPGETKLSFRSKPGPGGSVDHDVNQLARTFGGGGHVFAAGARVHGNLDDVRAKLLEALPGGP